MRDLFKGIITSNVTGFNINIHVATTQIKLSPEILYHFYHFISLYHLIFQSHIPYNTVIKLIFEIIFI